VVNKRRRKSDMGATSGIEFTEPSIFELGGKTDASPQGDDKPKDIKIPPHLLRKTGLGLPRVSEVEVVRHFTRLSRKNFGVDVGFYPLGSCTMKYNPKVCEDMASLEGFTAIHPYFPREFVQGALSVMWRLEQALKEISGMSAISLAPAAGAHGELCGLKVIRKALEKRGNPRKKVLVPDTAHGTNPASSKLCGYEPVEIKSSHLGILDKETIEKVMDEDVACLMITNPNTLGLFERELSVISKIVHAKGGFVYGDGANLNAILGKAKPALLGIDCLQFNLHKTFATPHGGGGPGAGPIGVCKELEPYLPVPRLVRLEDGSLALSEDFEDSIGRVRSFYGQFLVMVKALTYIFALGAKGLRDVAEMAVLNANYLRAMLKDDYHLPYDRTCMHEVVFSDKYQARDGVHTIDIAKRLMDYGFHPPTIYFPLIVHGALMIEPTETETKETLDEFISAMKAIAREAKTEPEKVKNAPTLTSISRPDEVLAARKPRLVFGAKEG
jgi:glycine dehydrogenase subunit 2